MQAHVSADPGTLSATATAAAPQTTAVTIAVTGSGGSGAVTAGLILLAAARRAGLYGLMTRSAGPQVRGGESAAMLRIGPAPVGCIGDRFDILAALDWGNHARFSDEIPLDGASLVLADAAAGAVPATVAEAAGQVERLPFAADAASRTHGRANLVLVGVVGAAAGLPLDALIAGAADALGHKGEHLVEAARACIGAGYATGVPLARPGRLHRPEVASAARWNLSGNEAAGLGALRGGVRFVAAYPITPASDLLEWLAPRIERLGGALIQAEDELAAINMAIGGAFGGVPTLTATSGPGLSLMLEGIGLAVASETPVVVVNVMRGGPSTGIPTKSEQADLGTALHGLHGDAPHLVLAALDIADCAFTLDWATRLAERLQTAAIVLSDQTLGQSRAIVDAPARAPDLGGRLLAAPGAGPYRRYADGPGWVSPMALPGQAGGMYTAEGLEHNERGTPSSLAADHQHQLDKRALKLTGFDYGPAWAAIDGPDRARLCLVTWGSASGATREAAARLANHGIAVRVIALRLIAPLRRQALLAAIGTAAVLVVEQNHRGQLFHYLNGERALPPTARSLATPGPLPLRPADIAAAARGLVAESTVEGGTD